MDELLEKELRKPSLIKNPRVLDLKYIPKKLLHREEEQKMLIQYFKPVIEKPGEYSQRVSIIGAIGTGKTAIALKFGVNKLTFVSGNPSTKINELADALSPKPLILKAIWPLSMELFITRTILCSCFNNADKLITGLRLISLRVMCVV